MRGAWRGVCIAMALVHFMSLEKYRTGWMMHASCIVQSLPYAILQKFATKIINPCPYHKQYWRCVVTGRSGSAVQSGRASRFF
jgi:hypothetical protein